MYLAAAQHFLRWVEIRPSADREVNQANVRLFLETHLPACRCDRVCKDVKTVRAALHQLLSMTGQGRFLLANARPSSAAIEVSVDDFDRHLRDVRGLADATRWYHRRHARAFLTWRFGSQPLSPAEITPESVVRFVTERAKALRPGSVGVLAYSLRCYVRFLAFEGKVSPSLITAIPRPRNWALATLPPSLDATDLARFLDCFDRSRAIGKRDYAMARCLADLGLRCCEVAGLHLDGLDWRAGVLHLASTKGKRVDALPIPVSTGQALVDYLRNGRPRTDCRNVFVFHRAPKGHAVEGTTVRGAIRRGFARAGLPWSGTHILRHTMATRLLQEGASLKEIADVLRHRSLDTTQLYVKVDLGQLARVALAWPKEAP
jgi:site-specific recombinase XerD